MPRTRASALREVAAPRRPVHHPMNPTEEFRRHAADCEHMAKFTRDRESRDTWNRMAQRWTECAERFQHARESIQRPPPRYRKPPRGWAAEH